uniref:Candidate secreted effector n=1 Tax=Meloidogyne incognita TaxID=6306 RepID=A0A914MH51_MELIC
MRNLVLSISQNPFKFSFRSSLNSILNSLLSCWLLQTSSQINNRNVWRRHTKSHSETINSLLSSSNSVHSSH